MVEAEMEEDRPARNSLRMTLPERMREKPAVMMNERRIWSCQSRQCRCRGTYACTSDAGVAGRGFRRILAVCRRGDVHGHGDGCVQKEKENVVLKSVVEMSVVRERSETEDGGLLRSTCQSPAPIFPSIMGGRINAALTTTYGGQPRCRVRV